MPLLISREPVLWDTLRRRAISRMETRFFIPGLDEPAFRVGEVPECPPPSRRGRLF